MSSCSRSQLMLPTVQSWTVVFAFALAGCEGCDGTATPCYPGGDPEVNLLANPSAECGVEGWDADPSYTAGSEVVPPHGESHFFAGEVGTATLSQRVDLAAAGVTPEEAGGLLVYLEAWQVSFTELIEDGGQLQLSAWLTSGEQVSLGGGSLVSGSLEWRQVGLLEVLPAGTASLQVDFTCWVDRDGSFEEDSPEDCDGYLDDVRLTVGRPEDLYGDCLVREDGNLLLNGSAECDHLGWRSTSGFSTDLAGVKAQPTDGGALFFFGAVGEATVYQDVDLEEVGVDLVAVDAGQLFATVEGDISVYSAFVGGDKGRLVLTALDSEGLTVTVAESLWESPAEWTRLSAEGIVPSGTRALRVEMQGVRAEGNDLDAYFDDIHLSVAPLP